MKPVDDLSVYWDPDAARTARVHVGPARVEIVLVHPDPEWVQAALNVLDGTLVEIVIGTSDD